MKKKRVIAALLSAMMLLGAVAGCNSGDPSSSKNDGTSAAQTQKPADSQSAASNGGSSGQPASDGGRTLEGNVYTSGLPIVEKPVTLRVAKGKHSLDQTKSYNEKPAFIKAAEETGITIEWNELIAGTETEKVNIMLAGGDLPDVFWALLSDAQVLQNEPQFLPLEDMLDKWAPNIMETYSHLEGWRDITTAPSGHVYGLLSRYESLYENTTDGIQIVNKKWLDAVGLDVPKTLDEYTNMLIAFRDNDPNGNGSNDEIPYCFAEQMWCASITNSMSSWGFVDNYVVNDGIVKATVNTPDYREFLEFYNKLANEKLIDVEGFSQTVDQFSNKIKSNLAGTYFSWTAMEYLDSDTAKDWVVLPPITAKEGITPRTTGSVDFSTINKNSWVITKNCKDPEAALRFWDYLGSSPEMKMTVAMGEKGILWDEDDKGLYFVVPDNTTPEFTYEHMKYTYGVVNNHPLLLKGDTPRNDGTISPAAALRDSMVKEVEPYLTPKADRMPQRYVTPEDIEERVFIETDLFAAIKEFRSKAILEGFTDAEWDAYVAKLEKLKYQEWLKWYQDFFDGNLV